MYLTLAIHHPRPDHVDDLLDAMARLRAAANGRPGLVSMGAWCDPESGRVFAMSLWESQQAGQAVWGQLMPVVAELPFDQWEERPREVVVELEDGVNPRLTEVT